MTHSRSRILIQRKSSRQYTVLRKELKEAREKLAAGLVGEDFVGKIHARYG